MTLLMTVEITQLTLKKTSINTFNLSRATNGIYKAHDFTRHISGKNCSVGFSMAIYFFMRWLFKSNAVTNLTFYVNQNINERSRAFAKKIQ